MKAVMFPGKDIDELTFKQLQEEKDTVAKLATGTPGGQKYMTNLKKIRDLIKQRIEERGKGP
jgi:hypothetical protein